VLSLDGTLTVTELCGHRIESLEWSFLPEGTVTRGVPGCDQGGGDLVKGRSRRNGDRFPVVGRLTCLDRPEVRNPGSDARWAGRTTGRHSFGARPAVG
jgi:hypothetical protein